MKQTILRTFILALATTVSLATLAAEGGPRRDKQAVDVLKAMSAHKNGLRSFRIDANASRDYRLAAGLLVSDTDELTAIITRPGSLHFKSFDGASTRELYLENGQLTVQESTAGGYAQAQVPPSVDEALEYAMEEFDVDLPLMDLVRQNTYEHLIDAEDEVHYIGAGRRIDGSDCHHIVVRTPEVDLQLWVEQGERPLPRRIVITNKWEGGGPRLDTIMSWDTSPDIQEGEFTFTPPEGSSRIDFVNSTDD